jgi:hypothetical protein
MPSTSIRLDSEVRDQLRARGHKGESYNDVILRLLAATRELEATRSTRLYQFHQTSATSEIPFLKRR